MKIRNGFVSNSSSSSFVCDVSGGIESGYNELGFVQELIKSECDALCNLLIEKNKAYGNSALDPIRIFSNSDTEEQIRVRLDDKLSRLSRGNESGEDVELDLMGYIILMRIARKIKERK